MFSIPPVLTGFDHTDSVVNVTHEPTLIIMPNPKRALVYISHQGKRPLYLFHGPERPDDSEPGLIVAADSTRRISFSDDGPLVSWGWYAAYESGAGLVVILEVTWHPEQIGRSLMGG